MSPPEASGNCEIFKATGEMRDAGLIQWSVHSLPFSHRARVAPWEKLQGLCYLQCPPREEKVLGVRDLMSPRWEFCTFWQHFQLENKNLYGCKNFCLTLHWPEGKSLCKLSWKKHTWCIKSSLWSESMIIEINHVQKLIAYRQPENLPLLFQTCKNYKDTSFICLLVYVKLVSQAASG